MATDHQHGADQLMNRFIVVGAGPAGLSLSLQLARGDEVVDVNDDGVELGEMVK